MLALGSHLHLSIFFPEAYSGQLTLLTRPRQTHSLSDVGLLEEYPLASFTSSAAPRLLLTSPAGTALFRQGHFLRGCDSWLKMVFQE